MIKEARTIGTKYKNLVQKITKQEMKKGFKNIENRIIEKLPVEMWDTWEGSDQEIKRIIDDVVMNSESIIKNKHIMEKTMKKKKQKIDEGMVMISSLLPVNRISSLSMRGNKKDNFEFKGLPGQFNEQGEKVLDEYGNSLDEAASFSKRHYIMIANILKISKDKKEIARRIADMFDEDNPLFRREQFLKVAGFSKLD